jgi:hypothetical protein
VNHGATVEGAAAAAIRNNNSGGEDAVNKEHDSIWRGQEK